MNYSVNEMHKLALHAGRGCGLEWGIAQEAARACCFLAKYNLNGPLLLCNVLAHLVEQQSFRLQAKLQGNQWQSAKSISPLLMGVHLADRAKCLPQNNFIIHDLHCPLFIIPFISLLTKVRQKSISMTKSQLQFANLTLS